MKVSAASLAGDLYIGDCPLPQRSWNPGRSIPQRSHGAMSVCSPPQRSKNLPQRSCDLWGRFFYLWGRFFSVTSGVGSPKKAALSGGTFQAAI